MIGAARPTVSLACAELEQHGLASRDADRRWTLAPRGLDALHGSWPPQATSPPTGDEAV